METQKLTPLMQQYWSIKANHGDKVVLFRMGDFYEMFHDDAITAAPILNIALTSRNKKSGDETKMCGVPHHSIAGPIARLLKAGHRVAICDQIEDPATAVGIVKRAVTRVLTPGMVYDPETLDQVSANYLASYDNSSLAFADITTGEAFFYNIHSESDREELLALLKPVELVLPAGIERHDPILVSRLDGDFSSFERLRSYIAQLQGPEVAANLGNFEERFLQRSMRLTSTTIRHLELFETVRGEKQPTLFSAIDRTKTSTGARLLKQWMAFPLLDRGEILQRQKQVEFWQNQSDKTREVRNLLGMIGDLERRIGKLLSTTASARDLLSVAESLRIGLSIQPYLSHSIQSPQLAPLADRLFNCLVETPPLATKEGGMIRRGVRPELDELIELSENGQALLVQFEAREKGQTGIASLKVRYNNVFGYYIELTKSHAEKAPSHYRRKQTLANAERFTTPELNELEEKILSARSRRADLEYEIYQELRKAVLDVASQILTFAKRLAEVDVSSSLAWLAIERDYKKPMIGGEALRLAHSRHPVVEQERGKNFVANSIDLESGMAIVLTGPNMAGKSTLMRQVALIAILGQMGAFVPASEAQLPIFTKILSRIGASDSISEGLSTFMVEMKETAEIVASADRQSLIIMDEIGRGTSTYDGLSLAQSILEFLVSEKKPYLFFATHYQELTKLSDLWPAIHNAHMSIQEKRGEISFLYSLKSGPANRSYGIHVAKLASLPSAVTTRAEGLLREFEAAQREPTQQLSLLSSLPEVLSAKPTPPFLEELRCLDVTNLTPLQALNSIAEWQRQTREPS